MKFGHACKHVKTLLRSCSLAVISIHFKSARTASAMHKQKNRNVLCIAIVSDLPIRPPVDRERRGTHGVGALSLLLVAMVGGAENGLRAFVARCDAMQALLFGSVKHTSSIRTTRGSAWCDFCVNELTGVA